MLFFYTDLNSRREYYFELFRYFGTDVKNMRRPLTDTTFMHSDSLAHPLESKPLLLSTRVETKSDTSESQSQENKNKTIGLADVKLKQTEPNDNGKHYKISN